MRGPDGGGALGCLQKTKQLGDRTRLTGRVHITPVSVRGSLIGHHPTDLACTSHQRERRLNRPVR